ncbi:hypothetical protein H2198_002215 [Neophaeococcomyces mojaviensis]|uniref:Uncharacterized protein n=1 Tax=Neophaeococcomyces mojaviensis TaxID=3383035 RepID=A0ACC3AFE5_9EURO|nr:hypothetical protein H2198_002215 [Knufia sp. JES_112]
MEKDGDHGPDAASIKPVSSLRAKFESWQGQNVGGTPGNILKPSGSTLKPIEPTKQPSLTRASLDLPRPVSPWASQKPEVQIGPQTPGVAIRGSESPTRSNHKRPLSMLIGSSPQLTPAVQVESPKSPPRSFFGRNSSRSPERTDATAFGKVRDLVAQHTGRSSTRASTPAPERSDTSPAEPAESGGELRPVNTTRPKSPVPPPINRADKPKIPAKPHNIIAVSNPPNLNLATKPLAFLSERRISPFSTPPSSDDDPSPSREIDEPPMVKPSTDVQTASAEKGFTAASGTTSNALRPNDPRFMGFNSPRANFERRDPRQMGFLSTQAVSQPAKEVKPMPTPTRIVPLSIAPAKDVRDLGFSTNSPVARQPPHLQPQLPSSPRAEILIKSTPVRDARQLGFGSVPSTPLDQTRPDLPQRTTLKIPPPRPTEESKRPTYVPSIARPAPRIPGSNAVSPPARKSEDILRHNISITSDTTFPPPPKRGTFNDEDFRKHEYLNVPTPTLSRRRSFDVSLQRSDDSDDVEEPQPEPTTLRHDYPDATHTNRRPPISNPTRWQIYSKTDGKAFDIRGRMLCTASYHTRIFDLETGDELLDLNHGETVKTTAVMFKPGASIDAEGKRLWIGNNLGDLQEIDLETHVTVAQSSAHNKREIMRIFRHQRDLWTLDEEGKLFVWPADEAGSPNLKYTHISHKLAKAPTYAMIVKDTLWAASGKEIRVYRPGQESSFNVLKTPLTPTAGDVTCGAYSEADGRVYVGHTDGKVTVYTLNDYQCVGIVKVSDYKINAMTIVGDKLWAVYKTGKVYVYDTSTTPWKVKKDWRAHAGPVTGILLDPSSVWTSGRLQVATTGHDQFVKLWDGMLEDDWIETTMNEKDADYCTFRELRAAVTTWNCGATSPLLLRTDFVADSIHAHEPEPPEILVFGFQEVVDLEDRKVTAKSILGFGKKKENRTAPDQQHQSKVYREWRDYLARSIAKYIPQHHYTELHTSSLIGLFSCIFVRTTEKPNISNHAMTYVKCGMGGHYGNKGALLARFVIDSSSLCFINCHLAAGQTQTSHRNNDVAAILESESLPAEQDLDVRTSLFVGGGDGAQILDHEICILNGDLNYRIDAMPRDLVIKHINNGDLAKLLERDQINLSRRRVAGFRLAPFTELPITFPPTYKYDVGKDVYDSSDKKRSPAWCDRLLYRSTAGRVKQLEYIRHEGVTYSDHRPVSGIFKLKIKRVDEARRREVLRSTYAQFEKMRRGVLEEGCVRYLVSSFGVGREEAQRLIKKGVK